PCDLRHTGRKPSTLKLTRTVSGTARRGQSGGGIMRNATRTWNNITRTLAASLIPLLFFCVATKAQSPYSRGPTPYEGRAGVPRYGSPTMWAGRYGSSAPENRSSGGFSGRSGWPVWQQGTPVLGGGFAAPNYGTRQDWPTWQQAPPW